MKYFNDLLPGCDATQHFFAQCLFFDPRDKVLCNLEIDICFEQRETDLAQCIINVRLADRPVTAQILENVLKLIAELGKHGSIQSAVARRSGVEHAPRVLAMASRHRQLFSRKTVLVRHQNQHARRVRYPEYSPHRASYFLGVGDGLVAAPVAPPCSTAKVQCVSTFFPPDFASTITLHLSRNFFVT